MRPRGSLRGPWPWSSLTACLPARFQLPHLQPWVSITPQGRTFRGGGKGWLRVDPFSGLATLSPMELGQGPGGLAFTLLMVTGFWGRGLGGPGGPASLEEGKTSLPGHPARLEVGQEGGPAEHTERMFDTLSLPPPGSYTAQTAARTMTPQEWRSSWLRSSPPLTEPRRTSYTPGPADESVPEEEEEDWEPPTRSVGGGGHPRGGSRLGLSAGMGLGSWSLYQGGGRDG